MPISIAHEPDRPLIRVILRGPCDREQIAASIERLRTEEPLLVAANVLWDLRDSQLDVTGAEVHALVDSFAKRQASFPATRVAVLAPTDATYGIGRMGQAYWEFATREETLRVFRRLEEAEAWLEAAH